jgi:hypothetical protein
MREQFLGDPCVLGNDCVGCGQRCECPEGNIAKVANRRGDDVEARPDRLRLGLKAESRKYTGLLFALGDVCMPGSFAAQRGIRKGPVFDPIHTDFVHIVQPAGKCPVIQSIVL